MTATDASKKKAKKKNKKKSKSDPSSSDDVLKSVEGARANKELEGEDEQVAQKLVEENKQLKDSRTCKVRRFAHVD